MEITIDPQVMWYVVYAVVFVAAVALGNWMQQ